MLPEWLVYGFAGFGALSFAVQLGAGVVMLVQRLRERARVASEWKRHAQARGVWP